MLLWFLCMSVGRGCGGVISTTCASCCASKWGWLWFKMVPKKLDGLLLHIKKRPWLGCKNNLLRINHMTFCCQHKLYLTLKTCLKIQLPALKIESTKCWCVCSAMMILWVSCSICKSLMGGPSGDWGAVSQERKCCLREWKLHFNRGKGERTAIN